MWGSRDDLRQAGEENHIHNTLFEKNLLSIKYKVKHNKIEKDFLI